MPVTFGDRHRNTRLPLLPIVLLSISSHALAGEGEDPIDRLHWLAGCWQQDRDGVLVLTARPSGQAGAEFTQDSLTDTGVEIVNPEHDFPTKIGYRLESDGSLLGYIQGVRNGETRTIGFPMKRVACE